MRGTNHDASREVHGHGSVHDQRIPLVAESENVSVEWHSVEHQPIGSAIAAHRCAGRLIRTKSDRLQSLGELVVCMSGAARNNDVYVVGGPQTMEAAVGDEERHHLAADKDDLAYEIAQRDGRTPHLLRVGMIEVDDHAAAPSRCRR